MKLLAVRNALAPDAGDLFPTGPYEPLIPVRRAPAGRLKSWDSCGTSPSGAFSVVVSVVVHLRAEPLAERLSVVT